MRIRSATADDCPGIGVLIAQQGSDIEPWKIAERLVQMGEQGGHGVFVADAGDGRIEGWIHVQCSRRLTTAPFAEIGGMVVDDSHRRSGVGTRLIEAAERWARNQGLRRLRVRCASTRDEVPAFYASLGFQPRKQQSVYDKTIEPGAEDETLAGEP